MAKDGEPVPTGWVPLDARLRRGGVPPGRLISVGGPPFAGKTTIVAQIALAMSQHMPVYGLFSDEGRNQAAVRMGVMLGIPLSEIEENPAETSPRILAALAERSIYLLKPDNELATAKTVFAKAVASKQNALVILDSVQTIPLDVDTEAESERVLYKQLMAFCRAQASEHGHIVLLTSQSNRASYRHKKKDENSEAIASFSGTAAIEYLSDVGIVLGLPNEANNIVRVDVVKNRLLGGQAVNGRVFHVRYDNITGQMLEVDPTEAEQAEADAYGVKLGPTKSKVLEELKGASEGLTSSQIAELVHIRKQEVGHALGALEAEKKVFHKKSGREIHYYSVQQ